MSLGAALVLFAAGGLAYFLVQSESGLILAAGAGLPLVLMLFVEYFFRKWHWNVEFELGVLVLPFLFWYWIGEIIARLVEDNTAAASIWILSYLVACPISYNLYLLLNRMPS